MSNFEQLSKEYAKQIIISYNQKARVDLVVSNIGSLTYKSTGNSLSRYDEKKLLLMVLKEIINSCIETKSADNANYLDLIAYIILQLKGG